MSYRYHRAVTRLGGEIAAERYRSDGSRNRRGLAEEQPMAQPAWRRRGSPIGKKGPRKANPSSYRRRSGQPWSSDDVRTLRQLARGNTPTGIISVKLKRPVAAVRSKAQREGISLSPVNRSPYDRRTKSSARR